MFGAIAIVSALQQAQAHQNWIKTLPAEEQRRIHARDAQEARERQLHDRALEVAEAGRARNFWGQ